MANKKYVVFVATDALGTIKDASYAENEIERAPKGLFLNMAYTCKTPAELIGQSLYSQDEL